MRNSVRFLLNGEPQELTAEWVFKPISDWLRYYEGLTGTKVVCAEGDCGACTVLLGRLDGNKTRFLPVNACIQYGYQVDSCHLVTVEGISPTEKALSTFQESMVANQGAQCGYCTPGFVMAMTGYLEQSCPGSDHGSEACLPEKLNACQIKAALTGNLCRCTGYEPIIKAAMETALAKHQPLSAQFDEPQHRALLLSWSSETVQIDWQGRQAYLAITLNEALAYKATYPEAKVVSGGTDTSVVCNKRGISPQNILTLGRVASLGELQVTDTEMHIGARVLLSDLESALSQRLPQFVQILEVYGSPQIKNAGTLVGNIANGSPIGDSLPMLAALEAKVMVASASGVRSIPFNDLYTGYRTLALKPEELIVAVICPLPQPHQKLCLYKVSKRKHLDISTFAAALCFDLSKNREILGARIALGGVAATVVRLPDTEALLTGKLLTEAVMLQAGEMAAKEVTPLSDVRGSEQYRRLLTRNVFLKAFYEMDSTADAEKVAR